MFLKNMIDDFSSRLSAALRIMEIIMALNRPVRILLRRVGLLTELKGRLNWENLAFIKALGLFLGSLSIAEAVQCRKEALDLKGASRE